MPPTKSQQWNRGKNAAGKGMRCRKTIRDNLIREDLDDLLPQRVRRKTAPSETKAGSNCAVNNFHYIEKELEHSRVWSYRFDSSAGWEKLVREERAREVLKIMRRDGILNVVAMQGAKTCCVGESKGGTNPADLAEKAVTAGETCLITNGNYYIMGDAKSLRWEVEGESISEVEKRSKDRFAVGFTTSTDNQVNIPQAHKQYYEEFFSDDGSSMMCGPVLKEPLDLSRPKLQYWCKQTPNMTEPLLPHPTDETLVQTIFSQMPGGIATASERNERLATVIMSESLKYVFVYTSERNRGVNINRMRALIKTYLGEFLGANIRNAKQVLNLDGGRSIFVAWVKDGNCDIIAAGGLDGQAPGENGQPWSPRIVTTMVKHSIE